MRAIGGSSGRFCGRGRDGRKDDAARPTCPYKYDHSWLGKGARLRQDCVAAWHNDSGLSSTGSELLHNQAHPSLPNYYLVFYHYLSLFTQHLSPMRSLHVSAWRALGGIGERWNKALRGCRCGCAQVLPSSTAAQCAGCRGHSRTGCGHCRGRATPLSPMVTATRCVVDRRADVCTGTHSRRALVARRTKDGRLHSWLQAIEWRYAACSCIRRPADTMCERLSYA
jgi:hypothetical protein